MTTKGTKEIAMRSRATWDINRAFSAHPRRPVKG
jgi:hypothetical protein